MYRRYAIYFTPTGALGEAGAAWLGWDMAKGCEVAHPVQGSLDIAAITKRPRRYGLHATLKPPMVLADGRSAAELLDATRDLAQDLGQVSIKGLNVARLGSFIALTAREPRDELNALAARVVTQLDPFRAALSPEDLARRRQRPLTPSQEDNLARWGYPHVMDDFNFHITLTGPLKNAEAVLPMVEEYFAPSLRAAVTITHLTVAGEDATGRFHTIARLPLAR